MRPYAHAEHDILKELLPRESSRCLSLLENKTYKQTSCFNWTNLCLLNTQDVNFVHTYNKNPIVLLTATHSGGGGNAPPECNGIASWIEVNIYYENIPRGSSSQEELATAS